MFILRKYALYKGVIMISIKEYAEKRNKSIQAVHQQRKRKKYKEQLKGHVFEQDGTFYLDDEAVKILDTAHESTVAIVDTKTKEKLQELESEINQLKDENNVLKDMVIKIQNDLQLSTQQILELKLENNDYKHQLEIRKESMDQANAEEKKGFFSRLFGR